MTETAAETQAPPEQDEPAPSEPVEPGEPVEPTEDDDEPNDPDEPAEPGEPGEPTEPAAPTEPEAVSPEEWDKRFKKLDTAQTAYAKKVGDIFEDDAAQLELCPLCSPTVLGFVQADAAGKLPEEQVSVVLRFLGRATSVEYKEDTEHAMCGTCDGLGKVRTGSRVPSWETLMCSRCQGTGMQPPPGSLGVVAPSSIHADHGEQPTQPPAELTDRDEWGEAKLLPDGRENPNFGKAPHYKVLVEPWGVTANLNVQDA